MAEQVAKTGVTREKDFMYFVKNGAVWRVPRKQPGHPKGRQEKVADAGFEMDTDFIYYLGKDGHVWRSKRAVGGQKRKKTARPARKAAKRAAPKKAAAKKGAAKRPAKKKAAPKKKAAAKKPAAKKKGKKR